MKSTFISFGGEALLPDVSGVYLFISVLDAVNVTILFFFWWEKLKMLFVGLTKP